MLNRSMLCNYTYLAWVQVLDRIYIEGKQKDDILYSSYLSKGRNFIIMSIASIASTSSVDIIIISQVFKF